MKKLFSYKFKSAASAVMMAVGIAVLLVFILFAIAPEGIAPYDPKQSFDSFMGASGEHLLGTNNLGYDVFSELVYATRTTLVIGLLSALISLVFGVAVGMLAGFAEGVLGDILNGIINFFILIPMLPLAIVIGAYLSGGIFDVVLTISLLGWCGTARAVRAKVITVKNKPFIKLMRGLGFSRARILFCHILPNVVDVALASYVTSVASCILLESTLGFLGVGANTVVTWGVMINYAYKFGGLARGAYNWLLVPGVCIMLLELAFYFINQFAEHRMNAVRAAVPKQENYVR